MRDSFFFFSFSWDSLQPEEKQLPIFELLKTALQNHEYKISQLQQRGKVWKDIDNQVGHMTDISQSFLSETLLAGPKQKRSLLDNVTHIYIYNPTSSIQSHFQ